jgi:hypothetical protein
VIKQRRASLAAFTVLTSFGQDRGHMQMGWNVVKTLIAVEFVSGGLIVPAIADCSYVPGFDAAKHAAASAINALADHLTDASCPTFREEAIREARRFKAIYDRTAAHPRCTATGGGTFNIPQCDFAQIEEKRQKAERQARHSALQQRPEYQAKLKECNALESVKAKLGPSVTGICNDIEVNDSMEALQKTIDLTRASIKEYRQRIEAKSHASPAPSISIVDQCSDVTGGAESKPSYTCGTNIRGIPAMRGAIANAKDHPSAQNWRMAAEFAKLAGSSQPLIDALQALAKQADAGICGVEVGSKTAKCLASKDGNGNPLDGCICLVLTNTCNYDVSAKYKDSRQTLLQSTPIDHGKTVSVCAPYIDESYSYVRFTK